MRENNAGIFASSRSWEEIVLVGLLLTQLLSLGLFLSYTLATGQPALVGLAAFILLLALFALYAVRWHQPGAAWAILILIAWSATADTWMWSLYQTPLAPLGLLGAALLFLLLLRLPLAPLALSSTAVQIYYGVVASFTAYVAFWGLFFPNGLSVPLPGMAKNFDDALPFLLSVPPLHARFIGSLYLSAMAFNLLNIMNGRTWREVQLSTMMILLWTGMLGVVSLLHLDAFDWSRPPVWAWFVAYFGFPIVAGWLLLYHQQNKTEQEPSGEGSYHPIMHYYFLIQGFLLTLLALGLLLRAEAMSVIWPWKIGPFLSHLYSAPLLAYGLVSFVAAQRQRWSSIRIFVCSSLLFPATTLIASLIHWDLFDFASLSAWLWFASLGGAIIALSLFCLLPVMHGERTG